MPFVIRPDDIEPWQIFPGSTARLVVQGGKMTALLSSWEPNSRSEVHSHPHEQVAFCLQGEMIFTIEGREYPVRKGDVVHIPSNVLHGQRNDASELAVFAECFSPPREDLLRGQFDSRFKSKT